MCDTWAVTGPVGRRLRRFANVLRHRDAELSSSDVPRDSIVSLTFDDGLASQRIAGELLAERGLTATFYVSSGLVGRRGNLGWDDLRALVDQGHEVGGHTKSHARLRALAADAARSEIESDRLALLERGLDPVTFAYPYGESSAEIESMVREAGYVAARGIGGVVETLPPEDLFRLRAPHSARAWTTAEHLGGLVLAAEHEQGWAIVPFHHLEDGGRVASNYTTAPLQLAAFLDWLVARDVRVVRVRDVVAAE